ncbi:transporter substrate-binding domain-containing protein [Burkholderia cepacia]|uniref:transporter substrate-binding domain-containing protein n=1 Tax=Burkholderia cepacia TaxID=292 RepID=UPI001CF59E58|nr:transporter substrate-binding domain-containing protein [Burkholderia cepacia]MCA8353197.1 transporter substrate-binding domain-containing protein [Burkholderia cepacia]
MKAKITLAAAASLLAAALLAPISASAEDHPWKTVKIATEGAFRPYNFTNPDGSLAGYEIDYYRILCAKMKIECKLVVIPFNSLIPSLLSGKVDVLMSGLSATPKRRETIAFSEPYSSIGSKFVTLKSSPLAKLPGDGTILWLDKDDTGLRRFVDAIKPRLAGRIIGVQTASVASAFVERYLKGDVTVREYKTPEEADLDLLSGRIDITLVSMTYMQGAMKKPANARLTMAGPQLSGGVFGAGASLGMRKGDTALLKMFDQAIGATIAEGVTRQLSMKWIGFDTTPAR